MKERIKKFLNEPYILEYSSGKEYLLRHELPSFLVFVVAVAILA